MDLLKGAVISAGFFALGAGLCYGICVDHKYELVRTPCHLYVQDKDSGMLSEVNDKFDVSPSYAVMEGKGQCRERSLDERIRSAFRELTR